MACTQPLLCVCALLVLVAIIHGSCSTCVPTSSAEHLAYAPEDLDDETRLFALFEAWNEKHGKEYPEGHSLEKEMRFTIFKQNLQYIHEHNTKGSSSFTLGLTRFADLTNEEFKSLNIFGAGIRPANPAQPSDGELPNAGSISLLHVCDTSSLPSALDWREKGAVVSVKNQGGCGSCWAFSAVGAMEGAHAIATGKLISLSEQELVSCDDSPDNSGCHGGWMDEAFSWVIKSGGIHTEAEYPYTSSDGNDTECIRSKLSDDVVTFSNYTIVEQNSESAFLCAVAKQPVSIAITGADKPDFQYYTGGVYNGNCSSSPQDIGHALLIVGWGVSEEGGEYWIAKNSWNASWGCEGYIYLAKGTGLPEGKCAMYYRSSYPTASASTYRDAFE